MPDVQTALFDTEPIKGTRITPNPDESFSLHFEHPNGKLYCGDSRQWLASLEEGSIDLVFADPPYSIKKCRLGFIRESTSIHRLVNGMD